MNIAKWKENRKAAKEWMKRRNYVSYPVNYKSFDEMGHFYVPKDVAESELLRSNLHNLLRNGGCGHFLGLSK